MSKKIGNNINKFTVQGHISAEKVLDAIAMIIEKRENVKVTFKIEKAADQSNNSEA